MFLRQSVKRFGIEHIVAVFCLFLFFCFSFSHFFRFRFSCFFGFFSFFVLLLFRFWYTYVCVNFVNCVSLLRVNKLMCTWVYKFACSIAKWEKKNAVKVLNFGIYWNKIDRINPKVISNWLICAFGWTMLFCCWTICEAFDYYVIVFFFKWCFELCTVEYQVNNRQSRTYYTIFSFFFRRKPKPSDNFKQITS